MNKKIIILVILILGNISNIFSQKLLNINFKVEKQANSFPMTKLEDAFFSNSYYIRPLNISFNKKLLRIFYDTKILMNEYVTEVTSTSNFDDYDADIDRYYYVYDNNPLDTIMIVIDNEIPYIQLVIPIKSSKNKNIGYTSYKYFNKMGL